MDGLRPVYVQVATLVDTDPLSLLTTWRRTRTRPEQFAAIVEADERMPTHQREIEWRTAATYLARYASSVDEDALDTFLRSVNLSAHATPHQEGLHPREVVDV